jgi:hypothetical protein
MGILLLVIWDRVLWHSRHVEPPRAEPEEREGITLEEKFLTGEISAQKFFRTIDRRRAAHQKGPLT